MLPSLVLLLSPRRRINSSSGCIGKDAREEAHLCISSEICSLKVVSQVLLIMVQRVAAQDHDFIIGKHLDTKS